MPGCLALAAAPYLSGAKTFPIPMFVVPGRDAMGPGASDLYAAAPAIVPSAAAAPTPAPSHEAAGPEAAAPEAAPAAAPGPRQSLCHNVEVLSRSGVRDIAGVSVAWLSGTFDSGCFSSAPEATSRAHYVSADVQALVGASKESAYAGVDIFLSSEWPQM